MITAIGGGLARRAYLMLMISGVEAGKRGAFRDLLGCLFDRFGGLIDVSVTISDRFGAVFDLSVTEVFEVLKGSSGER